MVLHGYRVQRVYVGYEVAAHAIGVNEFEHARFFDHLLAFVVAAEERRVVVARPAHGRVRDAEVAEDVDIKIVLAEQQRVYVREKGARLRALYDAVIVSRRDRHRLADAEA